MTSIKFKVHVDKSIKNIIIYYQRRDECRKNSFFHQISSIKVVITGDYKFYDTMLGKPRIERKWFIQCILSSKEWGIKTNKEGMKPWI